MNVHIVVTQRGRALVLDGDQIHIRTFADAQELLSVAKEHGNPPIVIDGLGLWATNLFNALAAARYTNVARTTD